MISNFLEIQKDNWMQYITWKKIDEYLKTDDIALIPFGQTEQHGPHLPMGMDTLAAISLSDSIAKETGVLVAPPIWYGWAPRMLAFNGSFTLRSSTLIDLVVDICSSLTFHGFKKLILINGHRRENLPPLEIAAVQIRYKTGAYVAILDPWNMAVSEIQSLRNGNSNILGHASGIETAHTMYIAPDLVNENELVNLEPFDTEFSTTDPFVSLDKPIIYDTVDEHKIRRGESGVNGDVQWATKEKGEQYHKALVKSMVNFIQSIRSKEVKLINQLPHS